jgi:hypothetical protein
MTTTTQGKPVIDGEYVIEQVGRSSRNGETLSPQEEWDARHEKRRGAMSWDGAVTCSSCPLERSRCAPGSCDQSAARWAKSEAPTDCLSFGGFEPEDGWEDPVGSGIVLCSRIGEQEESDR